MKGRQWLLLLLTGMLLLPALPASAASNDPWVFEGGGWGHGVGLSQYGAFGQAQDGKNATQILQHYYKGTSVGDMPGHWTNDNNGLWVGLVSNTSAVDIQAIGGTLSVCQSAPDCAINGPILSGEAWTFERAGGPNQCRFRLGSVRNMGLGECSATITEITTTTRVKINGKEYGRGEIQITPAPNGFHVVVTLKLEEYLYGLSEVPSSWHPEALRAQAIIGRSFAVATAADRGGSTGSGRLTACGCHIRSTSADQVYAGWSKENPDNSGDRWKSAVDATVGKILIHPQSPYAFDIAKAYYSSSNGGASENVEDVWGGAALPWLRSVPDQWSANPSINPLAKWSVKVDPATLASALGWDFVTDAVIEKGPPGVRVKFMGMNNGGSVNKTLNGSQIAAILNTHGFGYQAPGTSSTAIRISPYITKVTDPPGFDDILGHLFEGDIDWLAQKNVTKGCNPPNNTRFCPNDPVSREVMAAFLTRYFNLPPATKDYFTDDNNSTFEDDINRLAAAGITKGCGPTSFCPKKVVDRGQMAAFLVRAFGLTNNGGGNLFVDDNSSIFENDIDKLGFAGVTKGCNPPQNNRFCPGQAVSRGAMAAFLHRADGL